MLPDVDSLSARPGPFSSGSTHEPASRENAWGEVGAYEGGSERLSGIWSGFEHGGVTPSAQGEDQVTIQPVSQPISLLRQRMLEDMAMRGLRQDTQRVTMCVSCGASPRSSSAHPTRRHLRISAASRSTRPRVACSRRASGIALYRRCALLLHGDARSAPDPVAPLRHRPLPSEAANGAPASRRLRRLLEVAPGPK